VEVRGHGVAASAAGIRERLSRVAISSRTADGGPTKNLKDYPLETGGETHNPQRSSDKTLMLYQEGWGRRPHQALADLQRRSEPQATFARYAPARRYGFEGIQSLYATRP